MSKKEMLEHVYHKAPCPQPLPSNLYAAQRNPAMSWQNGSLQGGTDKGPLPTGTISKNLTPPPTSSGLEARERVLRYLNSGLEKENY